MNPVSRNFTNIHLEPGRHSSYGNMRPPPTPSYTRDTPNDMFQDPNRRPRAPNTPRDNIGSAPIRRNAPPIHPPPHSPSSLDSSPEMPLSRQRPAKRPSNLTSSHLPSSPPPFIKPEPRDNAPILSDDRGSMSPPRRDIPKFQDLRSSSPAPRRDAFAVHKPDMEEYPDSEDELQAQLALAEAEANAAKLRLKMASERNRGRKKGSGVPSGSKGNPVGLD